LKNERFKRIIIFLETLGLIAGLTFMFWFVWEHMYSNMIPNPFWRRGNWAVVALYAILLFCFNKLYGGIRMGYLRVMDVLFSEILSVCIVNFITYIQLCLIGRWKWMSHLQPLALMMVFELVFIVAWVFVSRWIYYALYPPRKIRLIYGNRHPGDLIQKMNSRKDKYDIEEAMHLSEGMDKIKKTIHEYEGVVIYDMPSHERNLILKYCFQESIRAYLVPKISDVIIMSTENIHLFDTPLLLSRNASLNAEQVFVKRCFDLVVSGLMLIVSSPFMLIFAIAIKCYDGGPVFYKQQRLTLDGKRFMIYKFRTMIVESERASGARLCRKDDDRITPVGRFLRRTHLDELPQIYNILKGEMSLVGPRPERPSIAAEYKKSIPEFDYRLKVKAGLTGYAQIYGKYNTTPYDKLKLDLFYIRNFSIWLDLKLLLLTFKILFQKENTEGVADSQVTAIKEAAVSEIDEMGVVLEAKNE
jgi:exopolysaccharide biosynthesis polyprenyl glycosylphosphotransferase